MLIIGHRGARGLAPENTMEALQAGFDAGADILEIDIRLTKDKVPVVCHDFHTLRTHRDISIVSRLTYDELKEITKEQPIASLEEVLDAFFGRIMLDVEIKGGNGGRIAAELIKKKYIKKKEDWRKLFFTSFRRSQLSDVRNISKEAQLGLLHHHDNPFIFIGCSKKLNLSAVGFTNLHLNRLAIEIAKKANLFTFVYTINQSGSIAPLENMGIDAIVTDYPDLMSKELNR